MKNFAALILSITLVIALGFGFSSCKDDDPPSKPKLSFAETEITANEDDGILEVELILDKPHSKDLRIEYELGGTASDQDVVGTAGADYEVVGDHGVVEIESGETTGVIKLDIYGDAGFEPDETIEISIMDINTDQIELTADDETIITVANDDEQLTASVTASTMTMNEADDIVMVAIQLDKPATADIQVEYELKGTAIDSTYAYNYNKTVTSDKRIRADYYINGVAGELVIKAGQSSGNIEIQPFSDFLWESDETIELTLTGGEVTVGTNKKITITLKQQNGKVIALLWDGYTGVDMDLILWVGEEPGNLTNWLATSLRASTEVTEELIFLPTRIMEDEVIASFSYGLSYTYYSGAADPLIFEVQFADFIDGQLELEANRNIYTATYTAANVNPWDDETNGVLPLVAQTFKIASGDIVDISDPITVHASDSRLRTRKMLKGLNRERSSFQTPLFQ